MKTRTFFSDSTTQKGFANTDVCVAGKWTMEKVGNKPKVKVSTDEHTKP
jgi:hypothetical protein